MPEFWDSSQLLGNGFCWKTTMGLRGREWMMSLLCHHVTYASSPFLPFHSLTNWARTEKQAQKGSLRVFPSSRSATDSWETRTGNRVIDLRGCLTSHVFCWTLLCSLHYHLFAWRGWGLGPQRSCCRLHGSMKPIQHLIQVFLVTNWYATTIPKQWHRVKIHCNMLTMTLLLHDCRGLQMGRQTPRGPLWCSGLESWKSSPHPHIWSPVLEWLESWDSCSSVYLVFQTTWASLQHGSLSAWTSWPTGMDSKSKCSSKEAGTTCVAFYNSASEVLAPLLPHSIGQSHHQSAQIQGRGHRPHFSVGTVPSGLKLLPWAMPITLQEIWNWDWDAPSYSLWVLGTVQWRHGGCGATEETDLQRESSSQGSASSCLL